MNKLLRIVFISLVLVFSFHLVRDVMEILGFQNTFTMIAKRSHLWCSDYCDYVTILPELFVIIGSLIVLKRNTIGLLGKLVLLSLIFWPLAYYLP
ncbi:MAG: hypothetical protein ACEQSA_05540 [Weeksellaceae bacterium]